jgi:UDP-perosamine 4-acetyltransferase
MKLIIYGAGKGGELIVDIVNQMNKVHNPILGPDIDIVGFLDDNVKLIGTSVKVNGIKYPMLGQGKDEVAYRQTTDKIFIAISTNMEFRRDIYQKLKDRAWSFANIIHPSAIVDSGVSIGKGNYIGAGVHVGYQTKIGDNNFISSGVNIEHHNEIGSHNLFGPNSNTSGSVEIGDSCIIGTGVHVINRISVGDNVFLASGVMVDRNINSGCKVKNVGNFRVLGDKH